MKKIVLWLLALMLVLTLAFGASAEQVTLNYTYGDDAFNKHMLDIANTVVYNGQTYEFEFCGFEFTSPANYYGGNVRTLLSLEVPSARLGLAEDEGDLYLGRVEIDPQADMELYVFSGDRESGQYTLVDQQNTRSYALDVYATRDENGVLRLIDKVFLYSCMDGGVLRHYAGSLYITYEGYTAAPAEGAPAAAVQPDENLGAAPMSQDELERQLETYKSMVRALEEERTRLEGQLGLVDESEIDRLKEEHAALTSENAALKVDMGLLEEKLAGAENRIAELNREADGLRAEKNAAQEAAARAADLEAENATLREIASQVDALTKELVKYRAGDDELSNAKQRIEELTAQVAALQAENEQLRAQPTAAPTAVPTPVPTAEPTPEPTAVPTAEPTPEPTAVPTAEPTPEPTAVPTAEPTPEPTAVPTAEPTPEPTATPAPVPQERVVIPSETRTIYEDDNITVTFAGFAYFGGKAASSDQQHILPKIIVENKGKEPVSFKVDWQKFFVNGCNLRVANTNKTDVAPASKLSFSNALLCVMKVSDFLDFGEDTIRRIEMDVNLTIGKNTQTVTWAIDCCIDPVTLEEFAR